MNDLGAHLLIYEGDEAATFDLAFEAFLGRSPLVPFPNHLLEWISSCFPHQADSLNMLSQRWHNVGSAARATQPARRNIDRLLLDRHTPRLIISASRNLDDWARLLALLSDGSVAFASDLLRSIEAGVERGARSFVVMGSPMVLTQSVLERAWEFETHLECNFGFIPIRQQDEVSKWIFKRVFAKRLYQSHAGTQLYLRDPTSSQFLSEPGLIAESTFDTIAADGISLPCQLCLLEFHAKECCAKFNSFVFCGRPLQTFTTCDTAAVPGCCLGLACIWPLRRIHVGSLNAAHVIAVSCGSLRLDNNSFVSEVGLGLNLFAERARSFISSTRFLFANTLLTSYLFDLSLSGQSLGVVARMANQFLKTAQSDKSSLVLLGDPDDQVDLFNALAPTERCALESPRPAASSLENQEEASCNPTTFAIVAPDPISRYRLDIQIPPELYGAPGEESGSAMMKWLLKCDNREGLWLPLKYSHGQRTVLEQDEPCPSCGRRSVVHEHLTQTSARLIFNCPLCGIVADIPKATYACCSLEAPRKAAPGDEFLVKSTYMGLSLGESAACGFSLIHCARFGWPEFENIPVEIVVQNQVMTAQCKSTVPDTVYPFSYWLRAIWITQSGLHWLSQPMTIRPYNEGASSVLCRVTD